MNRFALIIALTTLLVSTSAFSQRPGEFRGRPQEDIEHQRRLRNMEMGLRGRHAELEEREAELEEVGAVLRRREAELDRHKMGLDHHRRAQGHPACCPHHRKGAIVPLLIICFVVHILVSVWVYQDIRRRKSGSGIWIVVALLTGLFGALVYAIVRVGDIRREESAG